MAIAPVNKFISVAVPVAPGENKLYEVPRGTQTGITTINNVTYDEPTGVATVSCAGTHGFTVGNQITLAGIAFTCPDNTAGITTTIFPDPQKSYIVDKIIKNNTTGRRI